MPPPRESLLEVERWDEREAVRAAANRELHADLLQASVERLGKIAVFSALMLSAYLLVLFLLGPKEAGFLAVFPTATRVLLAGIASSVGLFAVTRAKRLRPQFITDVGYIYLFLMCLFLSLLRHSETSASTELLRQVSPIVIPILAFAALIPAAPLKALVVSFGAALMDPLALFMTRTHLSYAPRELAILLTSPLVAALVGHQISRVVHGLSQGIVKAREVGSYELVKRLGTGGMAEVWRANHRMLARPAAVKLIRPEVLASHGPMDSERLLRLFTREARATASLSSPHTIQVYDFGVTREGAFYYVMELLEGVDLQTLVERFGPQRSERVAYLLMQACQSLQEAHDRNFVHRDIKPANIFTCRVGGEYDFVKVLDFGLVLDGHPTPEELEDEKGFVGTPAVMAPEMVRFQAPVDARADLYALGCVGYWLLTRRRVFEASTRHDMLVMHAHQKPVLPSKHLDQKVHPGLEAIVMSCLEKNPNRRPQTARELGELLLQLRFDAPWTPERAGYWWKQHGILPAPVPGETLSAVSSEAGTSQPAQASTQPAP
jgi:serine/threonine-protein kinase